MDKAYLRSTSTSNAMASTVEDQQPDGIVSAHQWPARITSELGNVLVKIGKSFVDDAKQNFINDLDEFLRVYQERPDKTNLCGVRINHALAIWLTVRGLKPTAIIESGVNAGQSTYFMRHAAGPETKIFAIDPLDKPICGQNKRWIDEINTEYFVGATFKDLSEIDWLGKAKVGDIDPDKTLLYLDDHVGAFPRLATMLKVGFQHVLLEDNYKAGEGATRFDKAGLTFKQMFSKISEDSKWLHSNTLVYAEFPPLVSGSAHDKSQEPYKKAGGFLHRSDTNIDMVEPLFRPELEEETEDKRVFEKIMSALDLPLPITDRETYMQVMNYQFISYLKIQKLSPILRTKMGFHSD
eukprot:CAMPEP_0116009462 /NCGR_PEP_ID=MMETSP0321-20121206/3447_1 /TAXON_ID=163516 /ORGANISM="Leptocylindrus danicus var. danicus, Strain B650" /LENGTH=351 /DNA_ID=CAMNT_0003478429 /DNA_START=169 /DNA_END=1224 /DNA_ORIENTATION=-